MALIEILMFLVAIYVFGPGQAAHRHLMAALARVWARVRAAEVAVRASVRRNVGRYRGARNRIKGSVRRRVRFLTSQGRHRILAPARRARNRAVAVASNYYRSYRANRGVRRGGRAIAGVGAVCLTLGSCMITLTMALAMCLLLRGNTLAQVGASVAVSQAVALTTGTMVAAAQTNYAAQAARAISAVLQMIGARVNAFVRRHLGDHAANTLAYQVGGGQGHLGYAWTIHLVTTCLAGLATVARRGGRGAISTGVDLAVASAQGTAQVVSDMFRRGIITPARVRAAASIRGAAHSAGHSMMGMMIPIMLWFYTRTRGRTTSTASQSYSGRRRHGKRRRRR